VEARHGPFPLELAQLVLAKALSNAAYISYDQAKNSGEMYAMRTSGAASWKSASASMCFSTSSCECMPSSRELRRSFFFIRSLAVNCR